jgi:hypothetical protein
MGHHRHLGCGAKLASAPVAWCDLLFAPDDPEVRRSSTPEVPVSPTKTADSPVVVISAAAERLQNRGESTAEQTPRS